LKNVLYLSCQFNAKSGAIDQLRLGDRAVLPTPVVTDGWNRTNVTTAQQQSVALQLESTGWQGTGQFVGSNKFRLKTFSK